MNANGHQAMDEVDLTILGALVDLYDVHDPMPPMLPDVILLGLGATDLDAEMAHLVAEEVGLVGMRSAQVEHARRITFSSDHLTVMVAVEHDQDGTLRLDGWAAPGAGLRVELRLADGQQVTDSDVNGRFVFRGVPAGPAQIVLHPTEFADPSVATTVITPAVSL